MPGNHDYWSHVSLDDFRRGFAATGGEWLANRSVLLTQHDLELIGMDQTGMPDMMPAATRHLLLMHYPIMADRLGQNCYDLILAGHSHGGQVRIPFVGPVVLPPGVGPYDYGNYATRGGPLHVTAGIGMLSSLPLRVNCPPEITLVTI